jgi:hypothetical protein
VRMNKGVILTIITLVMGVLMCGCGVNRKSPEGVVKSLLSAYEDGKEKNALECYGMDEKADAVTKEEVTANIDYFKAHEAKAVNILSCDVIKDFDGYSYVYVTYQFELDKEKSYPAISTYLVGKKDKKYYVMPSKDIDEGLEKKVQDAYKEFMNSDAYKEYTKLYDAFITKHPGYEEKIAGKLKK